MILHNLRKTCDCSPSQWEAVNEYGERVYIRFRFDALTVHCPFDDAPHITYKDFMQVQILNKTGIYGDDMSGAIDEEDMLRLTGYTLAQTQEAM